MEMIMLFISIQLFSSSYQTEDNDWIVSEYRHRRCRADEGMLIVRNINRTNVCGRKNQIIPHPFSEGWIECGEDTIMYLHMCVSRYPNYKSQEMLHIRNMYLPCRYDEFQCEISKRCLPRSWVQDGYDDCSTDVASVYHRHIGGKTFTERITDGSDERRYFVNCFQETEFRCHSGVKSRCIPRRMVMDGKEDCLNGTDEKKPLTCHNHTEFMCIKSGRCILREMVNDGARDCPNGGDEMLANFTCIERFEFKCANRCIPRKLVQNGVKDCSTGEDESSVLSKCLDSEFRCIENGRCLPHKYLCDGVPNCSDGSDEIELCTLSTMYRFVRFDGRVFFIPFFLLHPHPYDPFVLKKIDEIRRDVLIGFKCYVSDTVTTTLRFIPQLYLYNNFTTCYNNEDICFDGESGGKFLCARCLDGTIISRSQICDGNIDCRDLSDECVCENSRVEALCELVFSSPTSKFDFGIIFDGESDLEEGLDEKFYQNQLYGFEPEVDSFTCSYADVTRKDHIGHQGNISACDGKFDCPLKEDECSGECFSSLMYSLVDRDLRMNITNKGKLFKILQTCFPFLNSTLEGDQAERIYIAQFTVAITEKGWQIEKHNHRRRQTVYCEYLIGLEDFGPSGIGVVLHSNDQQRNNCTTSQHHRGFNFLCDIPGAECSWHFYCHSDPSKKIEVSKRCDYKFDCADKSDEINCPEESHFYCIVGPPLFVASSKVGDGRSDCHDRSDECKETSFSSATEMLKHLFFRMFIWIFSLSIVVSNVIVLKKHIQKMGKFTTKTSVPYCNTILLINLALSDMIVGLTLLAVGVKSLQFSGRYCKFDLEWRSSLACNLIGISTLISSQTSMNLLALMTGLRLYVAYKPFKSNQLSVGLVRLLYMFCWASSAAVASYPVWGSRSFIHLLYVERNLFLNDQEVSRNSVMKYIERTKQTMSLLNLSYVTTDSVGAIDYDMEHTLSDWYFNTKNGSTEFPNRQVKIKADFGFYSNSSVCFPNLYSETSPAAEYSLAIVLYNLACLVFIVVGYILIFYRSKKSRRICVQAERTETKADKQNRKMSKRIFLIILTDVLCWLPIIIMSILSYRGYGLPEIVHPLSSIVFLPINSLINPIIYARLDELVTLKFKQLFSKIQKRKRVDQTMSTQIETVETQEFSLNTITK